MAESCVSCQYYVGTLKRGRCRRLIPGNNRGKRNDWPGTTADAWCGEWAAIGSVASVRVRIPGDLDPPRPGPLR
jgi:hypothetical protein